MASREIKGGGSIELKHSTRYTSARIMTSTFSKNKNKF